jgi:hydrogenase maturation protease
MTSGSPEHPQARAPILVLGLGNLLLSDDGCGLRLLEQLSSQVPDRSVEFLDGGTMGLSLLGRLDERPAILILDAIGLGAAPGTIHVLRGAELGVLRAHRPSTPHEGDALELLEAMVLLHGALPEIAVVGIEPETVRPGAVLSPTVERAIPRALEQARHVLDEMLQHQA